MTQTQLSEAIHLRKQELYAVIDAVQDLTHPDVVKKSEEIDRLIILWQRIEESVGASPHSFLTRSTRWDGARGVALKELTDKTPPALEAIATRD